MKYFEKTNINTPDYWNSHQTAMDFGLRQQEYAKLVGTGKRIVELGCGLSPFLHEVKYQEKYGVDFSPETVKTAKNLYPTVRYHCEPAERTSFPTGFFDAVVSGEVIEHLPKPELLLQEMNRICRVGGIIVLSTPILEFNDPEHLWEFDEEDLQNWGFKAYTIASERFPGRYYVFGYKTHT